MFSPCKHVGLKGLCTGNFWNKSRFVFYFIFIDLGKIKDTYSISILILKIYWYSVSCVDNFENNFLYLQYKQLIMYLYIV